MDANRSSIERGITTGFALGITAGVGYAACALAFRAPGAGKERPI